MKYTTVYKYSIFTFKVGDTNSQIEKRIHEREVCDLCYWLVLRWTNLCCLILG